MACDGGSFGCRPRLVVEKALATSNAVRPMQHAGKELLPFLPVLSNVTACDRDHHDSGAPCYDNGVIEYRLAAARDPRPDLGRVVPFHC